MSANTLHFADYPEFRPNLTPEEMFRAGVFGGTYFRNIRSSVTGKKYKDAWREFPEQWFDGLDIRKQVASNTCDKNVNKYAAKSGTSLKYWEQRGWIHPQDPYGWVQWYCRFYRGRRTSDDSRQVKRWVNIASESKGRWRKYLNRKRKDTGNKDVSPVVHQLLLQWAVQV